MVCERNHKHSTWSDYQKKTVKVISTKDNAHLFTLNYPGAQEVAVTWEDLDCAKIQWFEQVAPNYYPSMYCSPHLKYQQLKNVLNQKKEPPAMPFTWQQIVDFSEEKRLMSSFASGEGGDWKSLKKEGASRFPLCTVNSKPYWADAVGQIPFAINCYKYLMLNALSDGESLTSADKERFVRMVLGYGQKVHDGGWENAFGALMPSFNPLDIPLNDEYDNYFILRGALWAAERYDTKAVDVKKQVPGGVYKVHTLDTIKNIPAEKLAVQITLEQAKYYGLKK